MRRNKVKTKRGFLDTVIIIMSVILVITLISAFFRIREAMRGYSQSSYSMQANLANGSYGDIAYDYYSYYIGDEETQRDDRDYYAVGKYYADALIAHAQEISGDPKRAAQIRERMEPEAEAMGTFQGERAKIDRLLGE